MSVDWARFVPMFLGYGLSLAWHESAHAWTAWKLGDPTGRSLGRISLNPIRHVDLFGTILLPLVLWVSTNGQVMFGYAKPVPYNPYALKNPALGSAAIAAAGPISNFVLAGLSTLVLAFLVATNAAHWQPGFDFLRGLVAVNVMLALFNLIPIPPLDGGTVLLGLLPRGLSRAVSKIEPFGFLILVLLMQARVFDQILYGTQKSIVTTLERLAGVS